jgi:hypothetical protein
MASEDHVDGQEPSGTGAKTSTSAAGSPFHRLDGHLPAMLGGHPARFSSISRKYRGDVETIVAKALEKRS